MIIYEDLLQELCAKYNISPAVPRAYIEQYSEKDLKHLAIGCGIGKTVGLAIALKCCPDLYVIYMSSTHSRLTEFVNLLHEFGVGYHYMKQSKEVDPRYDDLADIEISKALILTNCMFQLVPQDLILGANKTGKIWVERMIVVDELPPILLKVCYDTPGYKFIKGKFSQQGLHEGEWNKMKNIDRIFKEEHIYTPYNDILTLPSVARSVVQFGYYKSAKAKHQLLTKLHQRDITVPKLYHENPEVEDYTNFYLSIKDVFLVKNLTGIIMDATADLYSEILGTTPMNIEVIKDYARFIDKFYYTHLAFDFSQRDFIINNLMKILDTYLPTLRTYPGPYYICTHNSSIYEGWGEEKVAKEDIMEALLQRFKIVETNDNKDFLLCRNSDKEIETDKYGRLIIEPDDVLVSNFNRVRGSNFFRDCRTVMLIGSFLLPESELQEMIEDNNYHINPKKLQLNLAIADAVQEISRGCLRQRNINKKQNVFLLGDIRVLEGVIEYMEIKNAVKL